MTAFLIVRAEVDPAVRDAFDAWYQDEHLPDAVRSFRRGGRVAGLERRQMPTCTWPSTSLRIWRR